MSDSRVFTVEFRVSIDNFFSSGGRSQPSAVVVQEGRQKITLERALAAAQEREEAATAAAEAAAAANQAQWAEFHIASVW